MPRPRVDLLLHLRLSDDATGAATERDDLFRLDEAIDNRFGEEYDGLLFLLGLTLTWFQARAEMPQYQSARECAQQIPTCYQTVFGVVTGDYLRIRQ
jgi:hypothetical protein